MYPHPDDHARRTTDTSGFKPLTVLPNLKSIYNHGQMAFDRKQAITQRDIPGATLDLF